jgi:hypothetical protein
MPVQLTAVDGVSITGECHLNLSKLFIIMLSAFSLNVLASFQYEINHLLSFVSSTDCQYQRNGTMHNGKEAVAHINKKYAYYADDIDSTEDFIKYSATKSKISGQYYKIYCSNMTPIKSQDWLLNELKVFRQAQK